MRRGRIPIMRCVTGGAGLLALLTVILLAVYVNRKLMPGAGFDRADLPAAETAPANPRAGAEITAGPDGAATENTGESAIITVDDENIVTAPAEAEATEERPAAATMEEEQEEPVTDAEEAVSPSDNGRYRQLFDGAGLPNLKTLSGPPPAITNDAAADDRIRRIAEDRGYSRRPEPADVAELVLTEDYHYLQPEAAQAYSDLKAAMTADGIAVRLTSAYRSYDRQRQIFLGNVAAPYADDSVFRLLKTVSIPGYSKHHTGYAVDLGEGELTFHRFAESASYRWLSAEDYANARKYGWIPSYPPGVNAQGPDPEPWEFVYVGAERAASR